MAKHASEDKKECCSNNGSISGLVNQQISAALLDDLQPINRSVYSTGDLINKSMKQSGNNHSLNQSIQSRHINTPQSASWQRSQSANQSVCKPVSCKPVSLQTSQSVVSLQASKSAGQTVCKWSVCKQVCRPISLHAGQSVCKLVSHRNNQSLNRLKQLNVGYMN